MKKKSSYCTDSWDSESQQQLGLNVMVKEGEESGLQGLKHRLSAEEEEEFYLFCI